MVMNTFDERYDKLVKKVFREYFNNNIDKGSNSDKSLNDFTPNFNWTEP